MADGSVRLDKWLWAARFYKSRAAASQAISAGKVEVNGQRAKPAKSLQAGDRLRVRKGPFEFRLEVRAVSERRGPALDAVALYVEDPAGKAARERLGQQLRLAPSLRFQGSGRPTKKDRREIERVRGEDP